jgi:hypothetical protein
VKPRGLPTGSPCEAGHVAFVEALIDDRAWTG